MQEPWLFEMNIVGAGGSGRQVCSFIVALYDDCRQLHWHSLVHVPLINMYNATASLPHLSSWPEAVADAAVLQMDIACVMIGRDEERLRFARPRHVTRAFPCWGTPSFDTLDRKLMVENAALLRRAGLHLSR